ncbi:MAG TPA: NAD(P)/FAD-dependent oxidoreductase [Acidimicrobiales bacterium]|nr:NAD(P)/FAD-dependent oxidoreductase [Acidimicrobiales bacterium]
MAQQADVIVVGLGVGGEALAGELAEAGLDVVGIENRLVGGECPYWACVPTKMMVRATDALAEARRVADLAGSATVSPDWAPVARRIRREATDDWDDKVAVERFESKGGRFVRGKARLTGRTTVEVDGTQFAASRALVIATGTGPSIPPIEGLAGLPYWTNREAVETTEVPASLTVIGAGAVGAEFAQVFARFGSQVTVVEVAEQLLPLEEPEAGQLLAEVFTREGIKVVTGVRIDAVGHDASSFSVRLGDGTALASERLLVATGRSVDLQGLGVDTAGLDASARFVAVDANLRAAEGVWAVGDITGRGAFTHVATYQARIAAADILGQPHEPADYRSLPRVTFTDPEVGAVGMTEHQAREAGVSVHTAMTQIPSSARGWIHKAGNDGFIKLVADARRGVLVGATSMGPAGGEVLGALAVAVHAAVPVEVLAQMIYAYPTFHRAIEDAVKGLH